MGTNPVQRQATADTVSENVKRLREKRNLGLRGLAKKLGEVGRPLTHSAVDQIEKGTRRVDVDDLMALAAAFDVSPITLLMPASARNDLVEVTGRPPEQAEKVWDWLRALHLRRGALALNLRRRGPEVDEIDYQSFVASNPSWAVSDLLTAVNLQPEAD